MANPVETPIFSKWRQRLFPVHGTEMRKFIPLLLLKLAFSLIYTVLHATKDTLIVTSKGSGAETIPILKGWLVLVFAFVFMLVYSKLSNHLLKSRLFYITISFFLLFFSLYGFVLYPNREELTPHGFADLLAQIVGEERSHWVAVVRYWMNSLFFLMAEMWGSVLILLSFWGLANRITHASEATRFYTLFSAGGHIGVIMAGPMIWYFAKAFGADHFEYTIQWLMGIVLLFGLASMLLYWWIDRQVVQQEESGSRIAQEARSKTKLSLMESLKHLVKSPGLGSIALMVIGYGLSVNIIEVIWKATLKLKYPDPQDYEAFMGLLSIGIGTLSLCLALFVGGNVMRKWGWYIAAQATPVVLGSVSLLFLGVYFLTDFGHSPEVLVGAGALGILVVMGAIHNVSCKAMKYCLFDPTKEMAFIPLDEETKVKGKAAVDLVASRFGKSGSSWIQIICMELAGVGSVLAIVPQLSIFVAIAVVGWIIAVFYLRPYATTLSET